MQPRDDECNLGGLNVCARVNIQLLNSLCVKALMAMGYSSYEF